jgi:CO/xanthine dehydrogenase Mo-binding subunit
VCDGVNTRDTALRNTCAHFLEAHVERERKRERERERERRERERERERERGIGIETQAAPLVDEPLTFTKNFLAADMLYLLLFPLPRGTGIETQAAPVVDEPLTFTNAQKEATDMRSSVDLPAPAHLQLEVSGAPGADEHNPDAGMGFGGADAAATAGARFTCFTSICILSYS